MPLNHLNRVRKTIGFRLSLWYSVLFILNSLVLFVLAYFFLSLSLLEKDREQIRFILKEFANYYEIEKEFLQTGVCVQRPVEVDQKVQQEIDLLLSTCEKKVGPGLSEEEGIHILIALEESEAHNLLYVLLNMTDSKVLSHFAAFSQSLKQHEARIQQGIQMMSNDRKRGKMPWADFAKPSDVLL